MKRLPCRYRTGPELRLDLVLRVSLDAGFVLPPDYFALSEPAAGRSIPDMLTLHLKGDIDCLSSGRGQLAVPEASPKAGLITRTEAELYLEMVARVTVLHEFGGDTAREFSYSSLCADDESHLHATKTSSRWPVKIRATG